MRGGGNAMKEQIPFLVVEDLEGGKFSIYDITTLEVACLDGRPQEGLDERGAGKALNALERKGRRFHLVTKDGEPFS